MRPLIILLLISSCGRQTGKLDNTTLTDNKDAGLYSLLDKLPKLKTPLTFNSGRQIIIDSLLGGDNELIKKIRTIDPGFNPYAKIYQTDDFIAVITISAADILMPVLATFDKKGQIIDSFSMYPTAGIDMGYYSTDIITLTESRKLFLTDSTLTRQINKEGTNEILGTDSLIVTRKKFQVSDKGEIEEIK